MAWKMLKVTLGHGSVKKLLTTTDLIRSAAPLQIVEQERDGTTLAYYDAKGGR